LRARNPRSHARAASDAQLAVSRTSNASLLASLCYFGNSGTELVASAASSSASGESWVQQQYVDAAGEMHTDAVLAELRRLRCRRTPLVRRSMLMQAWQMGGDDGYGGNAPLYALCPLCLTPCQYHPRRHESLGFACGACVPVADLLRAQRRLAESSYCVACVPPAADFYTAVPRAPGSGVRPSLESAPPALTYCAVYDDVAGTHRVIVVGLCKLHRKSWLAQQQRIEPLSAVMQWAANEQHGRRLADGSGAVVVLAGRAFSSRGTATAQHQRRYEGEEHERSAADGALVRFPDSLSLSAAAKREAAAFLLKC
jgi:hypothetical protein